MMGIRILCFILMVAIQPYGWYTWVFGAGAIVLPYIAVVLASVGENVSAPEVESPERALTTLPPTPARTDPRTPPVIRIEETRAVEQPGAAPGDAQDRR